MNRVQRKLVDDAMTKLDHLTEWESGFIKSIDNSDESYSLTDRQNYFLNKISNKIHSLPEGKKQ